MVWCGGGPQPVPLIPAVAGLAAAGAALAVKEKLDEHAAREEQKKQQHEQTMGGF